MNTPRNTSLVFTTPGTLQPPGKENPALFGRPFGSNSSNSSLHDSVDDSVYHFLEGEYYVDVSFSAREGWDRLSGMRDHAAAVGGSWAVDATVGEGDDQALLPILDMGHQLSWVGADKVTVQPVTGPLARGPT